MEAAIGLTLPADLGLSLKIHNGPNGSTRCRAFHPVCPVLRQRLFRACRLQTTQRRPAVRNEEPETRVTTEPTEIRTDAIQHRRKIRVKVKVSRKEHREGYATKLPTSDAENELTEKLAANFFWTLLVLLSIGSLTVLFFIYIAAYPK